MIGNRCTAVLNRQSGASRSGPATVGWSPAQFVSLGWICSPWEGAQDDEAEPGELPVLSSPWRESAHAVPASDG